MPRMLNYLSHRLYIKISTASYEASKKGRTKKLLSIKIICYIILGNKRTKIAKIIIE